MAGLRPARFLAPLALVACAIAFVAVLSHHSSGGTEQPAAPASQITPTATATAHRAHHKRRVYVVKSGDTPSGIASKTGVSLSTLEALNPSLDPQSLSVGERLKLAK